MEEKEEQQCTGNSSSTPSSSGNAVRRGGRQKKDYKKFTPELIGPKNKRKDAITVTKKNAAQADKKAAIQKKRNEDAGDKFFLQKYDEARALENASNSVEKQLPSTANSADVNQLREEMHEKLDDMREIQTKDTESVRNEVKELRQEVCQSRDEILGVLKHIADYNALRESHKIVQGVPIRSNEYMYAEHATTLYERVKWLALGYFDETLHIILYMEKKSTVREEGKAYITHTDCNNIWKVLLYLQKQDDTNIPGNLNTTYPAIRKLISAVFRHYRYDHKDSSPANQVRNEGTEE
ncbi:uncharacterized protein LOC127282327 [Leptopilina boulardi]|uniref:uncharacterized protein LOC127282327 n=1 Tax=Leptopilina boulardi TaxID=63433 RepID=UPI0021F5287E|nr:uncharacterized protein LOC127282327 [Leptopilina boulardi]